MGPKALFARGWALAPVYSRSASMDPVHVRCPGARRGRRHRVRDDRSWLIFQLTGGKSCDRASNASVTGSYDLSPTPGSRGWPLLGVPLSLYPTCAMTPGVRRPRSRGLGAASRSRSSIADQHAALFAQGCLEPGTVKCTHGTGTFLDMNIGQAGDDSGTASHCQIAWRIGGVTPTPGGIRASTGPRSSGSATARTDRDSADPSPRRAFPTTAGSISCRPSPACPRRTGIPMRAA